MKQIKEKKNAAKKQLVGGTVYALIAVTAVAVSVGAITSSFSEKEKNLDAPDDGGTLYDEGYQLELPKPDITPDSFTLDEPVSEKSDGINAEVNEPEILPELPSISDTPQTLPPTADVTDTQENVEIGVSGTLTAVTDEPSDTVTNIGYDGFIKPCSGYVSRDFSLEVPVYSATMYDYRTHGGIDIACEAGTPVKASSNGVITEISHDYMYGTTVKIEHSDGIVSVYSNLSEDLPYETAVGRIVATGEVFAGVGSTALCESAEVSHLHFEIFCDGVQTDPSELLAN